MLAGGCVQLPTSHLDGISRIVQYVHCEVDIRPIMLRRRPASGDKVPHVVRKPLIGTCRAVWSFPGDDVVYDYAIILGKRLLSCDRLNTAFSFRASDKTGVAYLVSDHSERVNVAFLRWVTVLQTEAGGFQQFGCHVSDGSDGWGCRAARIGGVWTRYDSNKSVIGNASMEIAVDHDVCL